MTTINELHQRAKQHTVKLGDGSGVLINGETEAYSYVLTAKHVVMECDRGSANCSLCAKNADCVEPKCDELSINTYPQGSLIATTMFCSETWDALILKVPYQADLSLAISSVEVQIGEDVELIGYPNKARVQGDSVPEQLANFALKMHRYEPALKELVFRNDSPADKENVVGYSGGGLFSLEPETNSFLLVGIENRMDNDEAQHGHICGVMLSAYTDIIDENQLAELKHLHLSDFKYSQIHIFHPYDLSNTASLDGVKDVLLDIIQERVLPSNTTPDTILEKFTDKLLAYRQEQRDLEEARLWIWFLEFLVILLATKPPTLFQNGWETSYLDELFSSYRFIYSNRHIGFKSIYRELLLPTSGLDTLHENSKIVLLTDGNFPPSPLLDKSKLNKHNPDISKASQADIATVRQNKELKNDVLHWLKLNDECLIECEEDFENLNAIDNEPEIQELLTTKYGPYLVIEE